MSGSQGGTSMGRGGAGCVAGAPQAARSCLYLERAGSSWLVPGAGWPAVALLDSWLTLGGGSVGLAEATSR